MKILEVRDLLLGSLSDAPVPRSVPHVMANVQRINPNNLNLASNTNIVQDVPQVFSDAFDTSQQPPSFIRMVQNSPYDPQEQNPATTQSALRSTPATKKEEAIQEFSEPVNPNFTKIIQALATSQDSQQEARNHEFNNCGEQRRNPQSVIQESSYTIA